MKRISLKLSFSILFSLFLLSIISLSVPLLYQLGVEHHINEILQKPSLEHWLGTDQFGRDIFIRSLQALSVSLGISFFSTLISIIIGTFFGILVHFSHPLIDKIVFTFTNMLLSVPSFLLGAIFVLLIGNDVKSFALAMGLGYTPFFTRMVRAQVFSIKNKDFIIASKLMGANSFYIIRKHIFPYLSPTLIMQGTMSLQGVILASTSLSFIGLGVAPPTAEWGTMIYESQAFFSQSLYPFLAPIIIFIITMLCIYRISDHLEYKDIPYVKK